MKIACTQGSTTAKAGLRRAAKRQRAKSPRPVVLTPRKLEVAVRLIEGGYGRRLVALMIGVDIATLRRKLRTYTPSGGTLRTSS